MKLILFRKEEFDKINEEYNKFLDSITKKNLKGTIIYINPPEYLENNMMSIRKFLKFLRDKGMTRQEWVNLHMFGDKNIYPACFYCKKNPLIFDFWSYRKTCCGEKECIRKLASSRYEDPTYKEKWIKGRNKMTENESYRINLSIGHKRQYERTLGTDKNLNSEKNKKLKIHNGSYKKVGSSVKAAYENNLDLRVKQSLSHKRLWEDDSYFNKMMENRSNGRGIKSSIYSKYEGKYIHLDSSWERSYFIFMESNNSIKSITRVNKRIIKYFSNYKNKNRTYLPDFKVEYTDGRIEIIEIKPRYQLEWEEVKEKKSAAEKYCQENNMTYRILTENELIEMGVLDNKCCPIYK